MRHPFLGKCVINPGLFILTGDAWKLYNKQIMVIVKTVTDRRNT